MSCLSLSVRRSTKPLNLCNLLSSSSSISVSTPIQSLSISSNHTSILKPNTRSNLNQFSPSPSRSFHLSSLHQASSSSPSTPPSSTSSSPSSSSSSGPPVQLKDEAIRSRYVRLVDPVEGLSSRASRTTDLLKEIDRSKYWLVQVKVGKPKEIKKSSEESVGKRRRRGTNTGTDTEGGELKGNEGEGESTTSTSNHSKSTFTSDLEDLPLVKLVSKKESYDKAKASKLSKSTSSTSTNSKASTSKQIQLTWSVSPNDLSHKLKPHRKDLFKGSRIRVDIITRKGGGVSVAGGEMQRKKESFLEEVERILCEEMEVKDENGEVKEVLRGRRSGEVAWRDNASVAKCVFEVVRGK